MPYYAAGFSILKERPDLRLKLREHQCRALYAAKEADRGANLALKTLMDHVAEGRLILPLVKLVVREANTRDVRTAAKMKQHLERIAQRFPKRNDKVETSYDEFRKLVAQVKGTE